MRYGVPWAGGGGYSFNQAHRGVSGWIELSRQTLGSTSTTLDVSSLPDKRYYKFLIHTVPSATQDITYTINADTGLNYSQRLSSDFAADATQINQANIENTFANNAPKMVIGYIENLSSEEKLLQSWHCESLANSAGTGSRLVQLVGKWANTANALNQFTATASAGNFSVNSELIMLGWDPADTHTSNFWTESSASTTLSSTSSNVQLSVGAHNWYWIQVYIKPTASLQPFLRIDNDSTSTYNWTVNDNGTSTDDELDTEIPVGQTASTSQFINIFVSNYSGIKKQVYGESVTQNTAGAANAPGRFTSIGTDVGTVQATEIDFVPSASTFAANSIFKVWFAD